MLVMRVCHHGRSGAHGPTIRLSFPSSYTPQNKPCQYTTCDDSEKSEDDDDGNCPVRKDGIVLGLLNAASAGD